MLLRHAKSAWPDVPDHERPLARRGQRDAPVMGRWLRTAALVPDLVLCSTARRARETWRLARSGLGAAPPVRFDDRIYEASAAALLDLIRRESGAAETLLVVGHDPAIPGLALTLAEAASDDRTAAGSGAVPAGMLDRMRSKFPTAAIAVFGCPGAGMAWSRTRRGWLASSSPATCAATSGEEAGVFWCFNCYAVSDHPRGRCAVCGEPVEPSEGRPGLARSRRYRRARLVPTICACSVNAPG